MAEEGVARHEFLRKATSPVLHLISNRERHMEIDGSGAARAITAGSTTVSATADALTASLNVDVVPDVSGTWAGRFRITNCERISGENRSPCSGLPGTTHPATVTLSQAGNLVEGRARFFQEPHEGAVTGRISPTGSLFLAGTLTGVQVSDSSVKLADWSTQVTGDGRRLEGTFGLVSRFTSAFGPQQIVLSCTLVEFSR